MGWWCSLPFLSLHLPWSVSVSDVTTASDGSVPSSLRTSEIWRGDSFNGPANDRNTSRNNHNRSVRGGRGKKNTWRRQSRGDWSTLALSHSKRARKSWSGAPKVDPQTTDQSGWPAWTQITGAVIGAEERNRPVSGDGWVTERPLD